MRGQNKTFQNVTLMKATAEENCWGSPVQGRKRANNSVVELGSQLQLIIPQTILFGVTSLSTFDTFVVSIPEYLREYFAL